MFYELKDIQKEGEPFRKIFEDPEMDLIVWYDSPSQKEIIGFQLAYGKRGIGEKAVTWYKERGFTHEKVDDPIGSKMSPILLPDGIFPARDVIYMFSKNATTIDQPLRDFIKNKMREYEELLKPADRFQPK